MTINVEKRLAVIRKFAKEGDYEAAHSEEDKLFIDVLKEIKNNETLDINSVRQLVSVALRSIKYDFARCCA